MSARPWFKVARGIHDHPRFARVELCEVACATWLFGHARHTPGDGLDVGQLRATYTDLVRAWRWERRGARPEEMVRRLLRRWSSNPDPMIAVEPEVVGGAKVGVVITVLRYADWQAPKWVRRATDPPTDPWGDHPTDQPTDTATDLTPTKQHGIPTGRDGHSDGPADGPADGPMVGGRDDLLLNRDDLRRETVETRAGARDPNPPLPGLESPEGVDGCIGSSPTSPAAAPASSPAAGVGPGAVERRWGAVMPGSAEFSRLVGEAWAELYRAKHPGRNPFEGNGAAAKRRLMTEILHPLSLQTTPDEALDVLRAQVRRYLAMGGGKAKAHHPLWFLVEDWADIEAAGDPKPVDHSDPHGWASFVPDEFDAQQERFFQEMMREQQGGGR